MAFVTRSAGTRCQPWLLIAHTITFGAHVSTFHVVLSLFTLKGINFSFRN